MFSSLSATAAIIAISVVGAVLAVVGIVILVICCYKRRSAAAAANATTNGDGARRGSGLLKIQGNSELKCRKSEVASPLGHCSHTRARICAMFCTS